MFVEEGTLRECRQSAGTQSWVVSGSGAEVGRGLAPKAGLVNPRMPSKEGLEGP